MRCYHTYSQTVQEILPFSFCTFLHLEPSFFNYCYYFYFYFFILGQVILIQYNVWLEFLEILDQNLMKLLPIGEIMLIRPPRLTLKIGCLILLYYLWAGDWVASTIFKRARLVKTELRCMPHYYISKPVSISRPWVTKLHNNISQHLKLWHLHTWFDPKIRIEMLFH